MSNRYTAIAKQHYASYANIPDDDITIKYAQQFPEYLQDAEFRDDYERIMRERRQRSQPKREAPAEEAGYGRVIGQSLVSGGQRLLGGVQKLAELGVSIPEVIGATDFDLDNPSYRQQLGAYLSDKAAANKAEAEARDKALNIGEDSTGKEFASMAAGAAPDIALTVAAPELLLTKLPKFAAAAKGLFSAKAAAQASAAAATVRTEAAVAAAAKALTARKLAVATAVSGASSLGQKLNQNRAFYEAQADPAATEDEKRISGLRGGLPSAITHAAIEAVATRLGAKHGPESLLLDASTEAVQRGFIKRVLVHMGAEAGEEMATTVLQSVNDKLTSIPDLTFSEALNDTLMSGAVGSFYGGAFGAISQDGRPAASPSDIIPPPWYPPQSNPLRSPADEAPPRPPARPPARGVVGPPPPPVRPPVTVAVVPTTPTAEKEKGKGVELTAAQKSLISELTAPAVPPVATSIARTADGFQPAIPHLLPRPQVVPGDDPSSMVVPARPNTAPLTPAQRSLIAELTAPIAPPAIPSIARTADGFLPASEVIVPPTATVPTVAPIPFLSVVPEQPLQPTVPVVALEPVSVTLPVTGFYSGKDQAKSDQANKFIGRGSPSSSTALYGAAWGERANTGSYYRFDKVFVSVEGVRRGRIGFDTEEVDLALQAGATIISDNATDRKRSHNVGERELADYLLANGYVELASGSGVWTPWTPNKPIVILPIGTSGSGKSTFIKSLPQENLVVISPDNMRVEFTGDINDKSKDKDIYIEAAKRAVAAIQQGKQVVFDTTNLTKEKRRPFIEAIKKAFPNANIQYKLMPLDAELAKQRIKAQIARGENRANVSDENIDRQAGTYKQMLEDIKSEGIYNYDTAQIRRDLEPEASRDDIEAKSFRIVAQGRGDFDGMRGNYGRATILNTKAGEPGWLGNPVRANDVRGGTLTREQATEEFRVAFLNRIENDPEFRKAVLALRGKTVGYYKPSEPSIHLHHVQDWLAAQPAAADRPIPAKSGAKAPASKIRVQEDSNLRNKDGSVRYASTNGNVITINPVTDANEFFDYFEGKEGGSTSIQKGKVLEALAKLGYSIDVIKAILNSNSLINRFLVLHEQSHIENGDKDVYWLNGKDLLTPDKIAIEVRATVYALEKLGGLPLAAARATAIPIPTAPPSDTAPDENIASAGRGGSELGQALTNVTYGKFPITKPDFVAGLVRAGLKEPTKGQSAEHWYQANKAYRSDPDQDSKDMAVMELIITAKLKQYPELVNAITSKGGLDWLFSSRHIVNSPPRSRPSGFSWEGVGKKSGFINALSQAYANVIASPEAKPAPRPPDAESAAPLSALDSAVQEVEELAALHKFPVGAGKENRNPNSLSAWLRQAISDVFRKYYQNINVGHDGVGGEKHLQMSTRAWREFRGAVWVKLSIPLALAVPKEFHKARLPSSFFSPPKPILSLVEAGKERKKTSASIREAEADYKNTVAADPNDADLVRLKELGQKLVRRLEEISRSYVKLRLAEISKSLLVESSPARESADAQGASYENRADIEYDKKNAQGPLPDDVAYEYETQQKLESGEFMQVPVLDKDGLPAYDYYGDPILQIVEDPSYLDPDDRDGSRGTGIKDAPYARGMAYLHEILLDLYRMDNRGAWAVSDIKSRNKIELHIGQSIARLLAGGEANPDASPSEDDGGGISPEDARATKEEAKAAKRRRDYLSNPQTDIFASLLLLQYDNKLVDDKASGLPSYTASGRKELMSFFLKHSALISPESVNPSQVVLDMLGNQSKRDVLKQIKLADFRLFVTNRIASLTARITSLRAKANKNARQRVAKELRAAETVLESIDYRLFKVIEQHANRYSLAAPTAEGIVPVPLSAALEPALRQQAALAGVTAPIEVHHLPADPHIEAWADAAGTIHINSAAPSMQDTANAQRVMREEAAHVVLSTAVGKHQLRSRFRGLTNVEKADLESQGYRQEPGESDSDYQERLADEYIAKHAREGTTRWKQFVVVVKNALGQMGLLNLSNSDTAIMILKALNVPMTGQITALSPSSTVGGAGGASRWLTPTAGLGSTLRNIVDWGTSTVDSAKRDIAAVKLSITNAVAADFGAPYEKLTPAQHLELLKYLSDPKRNALTKPDGTPATATMAALADAKKLTASLSSKFAKVAKGSLPDEIIRTIERNSTYLTISYSLFSDPDWIDKVKAAVDSGVNPEITAAFRAAVLAARRELSLSGTLDPTYDKSVNAVYKRLNAYQSGSTNTSSSGRLSSLMGGQPVITNPPPYMKVLMGEVKDPLAVIGVTIGNLAGKVAYYDTLLKFVGRAEAEGHISKTARQNPDHQHSLDVGDFKDPLSAYSTTKEFAAHVEALRAKSLEGSGVLNVLAAATRFSKLFQTAGNLGFTAQQIFGNTVSLIQSGHFTGALKLPFAVLKVLRDRFGKSSEADFAEYTKLVRLNLINNNQMTPLLKMQIADTVKGIPLNEQLDAVGKFRGGIENFLQILSSFDNAGKIVAFYSEVAAITEAYANAPAADRLTTSQIEQAAAARVIERMPSYSRVPLVLKNLDYVPMVGNFTIFAYLASYNLVKNIQYSIADLKNPYMRKHGAKSLAAIGASAAISSSIMAAVLEAFLGETTDEEKEEWLSGRRTRSKDKRYIIYKDEKGVIKGFSLDSLDPMSNMSKAFTALYKGVATEDDFVDSTARAISNIFSPLLQEGKLSRVWGEVLEGEDAFHNRVWSEMDGDWAKMEKSLIHVGKQMFTPSSIRKFMDSIQPVYSDGESYSGRSSSLDMLIVGELTATRPERLNRRQAVLGQLRNTIATYRALSQESNSNLRTRGLLTQAQVDVKYDAFLKRRKKAFDDASVAINRLIRGGELDSKTLLSIFKEADISPALGRQIISGTYYPHRISREIREDIQRINFQRGFANPMPTEARFGR